LSLRYCETYHKHNILALDKYTLKLILNALIEKRAEEDNSDYLNRALNDSILTLSRLNAGLKEDEHIKRVRVKTLKTVDALIASEANHCLADTDCTVFHFEYSMSFELVRSLIKRKFFVKC
jgi:hypothetical protein